MGDITRDGPPPTVPTDDPGPAPPDRSSSGPPPGRPRSAPGLGGAAAPPPADLPGGPFAAAGAGLVATGSEATGTSLPPPERPPVASLGLLFTTVVVSAVALVGAAATHTLSGWEDGRWWMLTIGLDALATVAAVVAVVLGVSALGEVLRRRPHLRGGGGAAVGLVLACALVVAAGIGAVDDWEDLDVPAAWDRLDIGDGDGTSLSDLTDSARQATTADPGALRTQGRVGGCYGGTPAEPGAEVACAEPHTVELLDQVTLDGEVGSDLGDRQSAAADECDAVADAALGDRAADVELLALVPDEVSWVSGDRGVVCLAGFDDPVVGRVGG